MIGFRSMISGFEMITDGISPHKLPALSARPNKNKNNKIKINKNNKIFIAHEMEILVDI